ncbi:hypothetical protein HMPREF9004_1014 [Schaalia cardiffensis F0333]|uniref:Uncharacterized protein n=1 Tax=Schaalia cardiffensis F0333 TaxID=888050 RepID=N6W7D1_9ACTO|nr:hypothetical protein HMPREF9004_1014 [Schaalia cardiffensis F0333]
MAPLFDPAVLSSQSPRLLTFSQRFLAPGACEERATQVTHVR